MRRTQRQQENHEGKFSILNRKGRSITEKRWNWGRCSYFLHLWFKWILKYSWSCRNAAFRQWLAWMQYNLWYNSVEKTAQNSVLDYMRSWSKRSPFSSFLFLSTWSILCPRDFCLFFVLAPFSWLFLSFPPVLLDFFLLHWSKTSLF